VSEEGQLFAQDYAGNAPISSLSRERAQSVIESIR
jgi:hypothetical protein